MHAHAYVCACAQADPSFNSLNLSAQMRTPTHTIMHTQTHTHRHTNTHKHTHTHTQVQICVSAHVKMTRRRGASRIIENPRILPGILIILRVCLFCWLVCVRKIQKIKKSENKHLKNRELCQESRLSFLGSACFVGKCVSVCVYIWVSICIIFMCTSVY